MIAEIKWFYRVTELPEAVYLLLMEDRKNGRPQRTCQGRGRGGENDREWEKESRREGIGKGKVDSESVYFSSISYTVTVL